MKKIIFKLYYKFFFFSFCQGVKNLYLYFITVWNMDGYNKKFIGYREK